MRSVLFTVLFCGGLGGGVLAGSPEGERIVDGDFGSLDGWQILPIPTGFVRDLVAENSAFTDIYPSNHSCLKLADNPESTAAHVRYLRQGIFSASRKVVFSVDFKFPSEDSEQGFIIVMNSDKTPVFNAILRNAPVINQHIRGENNEHPWQIPNRVQLESGSWYRLQCTIDMDERILTGTLRSEGGDSWDIVDHPIAINTADPDAVITEIFIASAVGSKASAPPILIDNISLRPEKAP